MKRTLTVSPTTYKKGKYARQRLRGRRVPRPLATKYHNFVRSVSTTGNSLAYDEYLGFSTAVKDLQFSFQLSGVTVYLAGVTWLQLGMPNYTELTALYDQYRIDWVECEFYFSNNYSTVNVPERALPIVYLAKDYDDVASATVQALQQYDSCQTWQTGHQQPRGKHVIRVRPNVDIGVYQGVTTGYARGKPMFIDTTYPSVPHYGIKLCVDSVAPATASTPVGYFSINFKYHFTMAHTK